MGFAPRTARRLAFALTCVVGCFVAAAPASAAPGDLDPSFSGNGVQATSFTEPTISGSGNDTGADVAIQRDGRIVVVGTAGDYDAGSGQLAVARYMPDGSLDPSFDGDGRLVVSDFYGGVLDISRAAAVAIQPDGKVVVAGQSDAFGPAQGGDFAVVRINPDGSLDTSFGGDGRQTTDLGRDPTYANEGATAVAIQLDGRLVVAGNTRGAADDSGDDFALVRYLPDGTLDPSFDGDGRQSTAFGGASGGTDLATGVGIQPDGRIVVAGDHGSPFNFALARYERDGSLDPSFGDGGRQITDFGSDFDVTGDLAIQPDGRLVVAGATATPGDGQDFALARYLPDGTLDSVFSGDGRVTTDFGGRLDFAGAVAVQLDGRILAGGQSQQDGSPDPSVAALARYSSAGALDDTFGRGGRVTTADSSGGSIDSGAGLALQLNGGILLGGTGRERQGTGTDLAVARYLGGPLAGSNPPPGPRPGRRDRTAPRVRISGVPRRGCTRRSFTARVRVREGSSVRVRVRLDGRTVRLTRRKRFGVRVRTRRLRRGRHRLTVRARDRAGNLRVRSVRFRRCGRSRPRFTG